ncbi:apolipoprotein C-II isoform X3 [Rhea pennata]|uniref:apolipoprotein C-II isoform X3 n=1 Tax=Rhea pennata TaxID=8795 RepID=UPI002E26295C
MARTDARAMAAALLLLLCAEAASHRLQQRDTADPSQLQTKATGYLAQASSIAQGWLEKISVPMVQEKIRDAYSKGSEAVLTYTGILTDQLYHWWCGEQ